MSRNLGYRLLTVINFGIVGFTLLLKFLVNYVELEEPLWKKFIIVLAGEIIYFKRITKNFKLCLK